MHFTLKYAMLSYLNHTLCKQYDYIATKTMNVMLYTYSQLSSFQNATLLQTWFDHSD